MSEKVMLVDDDPKLVGLVQHHLDEEGFETIWASTGEEALDILIQERPAAIILDLHLPGRFEVLVGLLVELQGCIKRRVLRRMNFELPWRCLVGAGRS